MRFDHAHHPKYTTDCSFQFHASLEESCFLSWIISEMPRRRSLETDSEEEERPARNAANARERARMRVLSRAFSRLKTKLPWVPPDTKLSKLDTLRLATSYIAYLRRELGASQPQPILPHPVSFSWPFTFHGSPPMDCQQEQEQQHLYPPPTYTSDSIVQIG